MSPCPVSALVPLATEKSAPSSSGRWPSGVARVLSTATRAPRRVRGLDEPPHVADVEPGVGRCLDPQQPGAVQDRRAVRRRRSGAVRTSTPYASSCWRTQRQRLVAVVGQDDRVAGPHLGEAARPRSPPCRRRRPSVSTPSCPGASSSPMARSRWVQVGFVVPAVGVRAGRARRAGGSARRRPGRAAWVRTAPARAAPPVPPGSRHPWCSCCSFCSLVVPVLLILLVRRSLRSGGISPRRAGRHSAPRTRPR